jgi:L,D-transpeptidase YcbB
LALRVVAASLCLLLPLAAAAQATLAQVSVQPDPVVEALRERIDALATSGQVAVEGDTLRAARALPELYQANGFRPLWDEMRLRALRDVLQDIEDDGLLPADYHLAALDRLRDAHRSGSPLQRATLDLLATDAYALVLYHLYFGKVDPVSIEPGWNFEQREITESDAIAFVLERIRSNRIRESLSDARPDHWLYAAGREALASHRAIAALGGWPQIPAGPTLKPGLTDPRVPLLRARLALTGDFATVARGGAAEAASPELFDAPLEAALRHFQRRHRIAVDGAAGPGTLRELNVPVQQRLAQIRVNVERARWVLHEIGAGDLVLIDIAGFNVRYLRDRETLWRTRAQVGRPYRETPIFRSAIDHVVFNPTWTVPPGIIAKDILPELRRGGDVLRRKRLSVLDLSGRPVDPTSIVVPPPGSTRFPYVLRQDPGPDNALGAVKIMFPNPYFVYLHDTPSKSLFDADSRAFSSGCIRVDQPLDLVARLLATDAQWTPAAIQAAVDSGNTRTVRLPRPVPVLLIYWTMDRDDDGSLVFKPDIYARDARLLAALDARFRVGARAAL